MCMNCQIEARTGEEFAERMLEILNHGAISLMLSIGHRTGLFDTMRRIDRPATSAELAKAAGLNERYVREWLGAMTTGRIVACDPEGPRFWLPETHAPFLTRAGGSDNMATVGQFLGVLGGVEDSVVAAFRNGGGVPYAEYKRFHEVMAEESGQSVVSALIDTILPAFPEIMEKLENGARVMDLGCGRGKALMLLAREFPQSTFVGIDLSAEAIEYARSEAQWQGLKNITFEQRDLTTYDVDATPESADLVFTFDAVHDQMRPDRMLAGIHRSLAPGGIYLMQDIKGSSNVWENMDNVLAPFMYTISCMHCMTVSLAAGGMGLGAMWGRQKALEMLEAAGFADIKIQTFDHDIQNYWYFMTN